MSQSSSSRALGARLKERPLSPHMQIYRPEVTSVLAVFHRVTGLGLSFGMMLLVAWLVCLASGKADYDVLASFFALPFGRLVLFGFSWALFYHLCSTIRHVVWDMGYFVSNEGVDKTGLVAVVVSTLATLGVWAKISGVFTWL